MKVAIAQPTYLSWAGYFDLMDQVDVFVILDSVQFEKQSWQQRNRIKTPAGLQWLTVPVVFRGRLGQLIREVEIRELEFARMHLRAIELNYRRAPFFDQYYPGLSEILREAVAGGLLVDLNLRLMDWLMGHLGLSVPRRRSSEMGQPGKRTELLANLLQSIGADQYLSPIGSADYLLEEMNVMTERGIAVAFQHYEHPEYRQQYPPFQPYATVLDLLFNEGDRSLEILRSGRRTPYTAGEVAGLLAKRVEA